MTTCGQVSPQLQAFAATNAAFSQQQWEVAKQDGCAPCTAAALPSWPPKDTTSFTYPMMANMEEVSGLDTAKYGAPYTPSPTEVAANNPGTLACSLPPQYRGSQFLPDQPLAQSNLQVPAVSFGVGELTPVSGTMPDEQPSPTQNVLADTAANMSTALSGTAYGLTNMDAVPGDGVAEKLAHLWSMHSRGLVVWLLVVVVLAVLLSLVA